MPLSAQPLAFYRNNGTDATGNGNTLAATGTPGTGPGIDGTPDAAMVVGATVGLWSGAAMVTGGPFSISAWAKLTAVPPTGPLVLTNLSPAFPATEPHIEIDLNPTDVEVGFFYRGSTAFATGPAVADAGWHHYVLTATPDTVKLYVDGVLTDTQTGTADFTGISSFGIALNVGTETLSEQYIGVWGAVLTQADVTALYNGGAGLDPTAATGITEITATARQPFITAAVVQ